MSGAKFFLGLLFLVFFGFAFFGFFNLLSREGADVSFLALIERGETK